MRKKDSICSSDRPLVSGTQQPVKARFTRHTAAKKKKGACRPKAFCGGERGSRGASVSFRLSSASQPGGRHSISLPVRHPGAANPPQEIQLL